MYTLNVYPLKLKNQEREFKVFISKGDDSWTKIIGKDLIISDDSYSDRVSEQQELFLRESILVDEEEPYNTEHLAEIALDYSKKENKVIVKKYLDHQLSEQLTRLSTDAKAGLKFYRKGNFGYHNFMLLEKEDSKTWFFNQYSLRISFNGISGGYEICIAHVGTQRVLKKTVDEYVKKQGKLEDITKAASPDGIIRKEDIRKKSVLKRKHMYPFLNLDIEKNLKMSHRRSYAKLTTVQRQKRVDTCLDYLLEQNIFTNDLQLQRTNPFILEESAIHSVPIRYDNLLFGAGETSTTPSIGLSNFGCQHSDIGCTVQFHVIAHENNKREAGLAKEFVGGSYPDDKYKCSFTEMTDIFEESDAKIFLYKDIKEVLDYADSLNRMEDVQPFFIILNSANKTTETDRDRFIHYRLKEQLLIREIATQTIRVASVRSSNFHNYRTGLFSSMAAKLGAVPWTLSKKALSNHRNDLVIGVSAHHSKYTDATYMGSAFTFRGDGAFEEYDCFLGDDMEYLKESIRKYLIKTKRNHPDAERLVIHFYKQMKRRLIMSLEHMLRQLDMDIPVIVIEISSSPMQNYQVVDTESPDGLLTNRSYMAIGKRTWLLWLNNKAEKKKNDPKHPRPLKLIFSCSDHDYLTEEKMSDLIHHIYGFSNLNWSCHIPAMNNGVAIFEGTQS